MKGCELMSIERIKQVFLNLENMTNRSAHLLKINFSRKAGITYLARVIEFADERTMNGILKDISEYYLNPKKGKFKTFNELRSYDGTTLSNVIYTLNGSDNPLISEEFSKLKEAIAHSDMEIDPLGLKSQAFVFCGSIKVDLKSYSIKLISMQNPITNLKNKFLRKNGSFNEITEKVLSIKKTIDVMIIDDTVYMFNFSGENLFHMERAYKAYCAEKLDSDGIREIIADYDAFSLAANKGHNPRKFVSFQDSYLEKLQDSMQRKSISEKFNIPLKETKFDTEKEENSNKLIKVLCSRGMLDPFDQYPMEVAGSKRWE